MVKSTQEIVDFIKNEVPLRNPRYYQSNFHDYYQSARRNSIFKCWENAVIVAGKDYDSSLIRKPHKYDDIEGIIRRRIDLGRNVNAYHIHEYYLWIEKAAREYGGYPAIIEKCGKSYDKILKTRSIKDLTEKELIFEILKADAKQIDISATGFNYYDTSVYGEILRKFSNHPEYPFISNYDWALVQAGINPESARLHKNPDKYAVLLDLREHVAEGHSSYWLKKNGYFTLVRRAQNHFGMKVGNAFTIARFLEGTGLYDRLPQFEQRRKYATMISGLRNVSTDGRKSVRRNRSYIMNLDRPTKPIATRELKQKLRTLESCLWDAETFVTQREIRAKTDLHSDFLVAATPTRTIDCMFGTDLIIEAEKRYPEYHFFGPKTEFCTYIFYWHIKNADKLMHDFVVKHLK